MQTKILPFIKNTPFFWLLIPVFFILKNTAIYFEVIPKAQIIKLSATYIAGAIIFYFIIKKIFKQQHYKAALYSGILLSIYFFFGIFSRFIIKLDTIQPFNRYRYIFILLALLTIPAWARIRKMKTPPLRLILFLNVLLIIFCLEEGGRIIYHLIRDKDPLLNSGPALSFDYDAARNARHPNIYFLLFDEYLGNEFLQKKYNYDNEKLKSFLAKNDFFIPRLSRSNYNYTCLSVSSILNMNYIGGKIRNNEKMNLVMTEAAVDLIANANTLTFLKKNNYRIINLSPFQIDKSPKIITSYNVITGKEDLIKEQTFFNVIFKKFGWHINNEKWLKFIHFDKHDIKYYNNDTQEELVRGSKPDSAADPRFTYAHFYMPHFPFLKDSLGNDLNLKYLMQLGNDVDTRNTDMNTYKLVSELYISYIKHVNTVLIGMVENIIKNDPNAILLIMSDHGFRVQTQDMIFNTQFYVRIPGSDYSNWPDTVDAVNVFRLLFNNEFNQKLDYLPYRATRVTLQ